LPALYSACDFVAVPSLYEGMPNVLLEAMAAGAVPLVSSAGAMDAVVRDGETGLVFPPGDHHRMAEAISRAVSLEAAARDAMAGRARRFVQEHFSVEKELDAIWSIVGTSGGHKKD
jgi:glycosyltransferase involved in cell wall biosynthesis